MNKLIVAFTYIVILTASSASAQPRRSLKDIDRELKQTKSTATAMALIESIADTPPQTDDEVAVLGQLMDKYPVQGQKALAGIKDPKLAGAIEKECNRFAERVKADKDKDWSTLPKDQKREKVVAITAAHAMIAVLGNIKNKDSLPFLKQYITPEYDGLLSYEASQAIGKIAPDDPAVFNELWNKNDVRNISYSAYGPSLLKEVAQKMEDPNISESEKDKLRSKANIFFLSGKVPEEKRLIKDILLNHPNREFREDAAVVMVHAVIHNPEEADKEFLITWINKENSLAARDTVYAMNQIWDKKFIPSLIEVLKNKAYWAPRDLAAETLGRHQVKEAVPYLEEALKDKDSTVRGSALMALVNILGKDYHPKYAYPGDAEKKMRKIMVQPKANK